jgi:hypothetical protein
VGNLQKSDGQRRSVRLLRDEALIVRGESIDNRPFRESTFTLTVSAHGALLVMETKVAMGQPIVLMNPKNWDEREGRIAYVGPAYAGLAKVGVEFREPAPEFWSVSSPPADWERFRSALT